MRESSFRTQALSLGRETDQIAERLLETFLPAPADQPCELDIRPADPAITTQQRQADRDDVHDRRDGLGGSGERKAHEVLVSDRTRSKVTRLDTTRRASRGQTSAA